MIFFPACATCSRFRRDVKSKDVCEAFPNGIPEDILRGRNDHRQTVAGDRGLTYNPLPGFEEEDPNGEWTPAKRGESSKIGTK
jgi:hypothetical protein